MLDLQPKTELVTKATDNTPIGPNVERNCKQLESKPKSNAIEVADQRANKEAAHG